MQSTERESTNIDKFKPLSVFSPPSKTQLDEATSKVFDLTYNVTKKISSFTHPRSRVHAQVSAKSKKRKKIGRPPQQRKL